MTRAFNFFGPTPDDIRRKANWLGRYLDVEGKFDDKLKGALGEAASHIDKTFAKYTDDTKTGRVRRMQLALAHKEVRGHINDLFGTTGNLIRDHRQDAAVAAVNARLFDERGLLARIFGDKADREQYADSLRETARRNIESVVTRVLHTEQPLSKRVWKTRALAQGQISTAINNGLARGDSAVNIAKDVKALVRPDVSGGVSYAAKRLGRTEINNAFHAQSIFDAQNVPWIHQMHWYLSKVHESDPGDVCEDYAQIALFDVEHVPNKPHPNCRCFVTPEQEPYEQFETSLISGQYDQYLEQVNPYLTPDIQGFASAQPTGEIYEPVRWTGPKVGMPTENENIRDKIAYDWKMPTWDQNKQFIREGIRDVEQNGYAGYEALTKGQKSAFSRAIQNIPYDDVGELTQAQIDALRAEGWEIAAIAVDSPPYRETRFYRGIRVTESQLNDIMDQMRPGNEISMEASSFVEKENAALGFAGHPRFMDEWSSRDVPKGADRGIVFQIEPGAKVAEIPWMHGSLDEVAAFGKFDIVDVIPGHPDVAIKDYDQVWNEAKKAYDYIPNEVEYITPTRIILRQTSMIEDMGRASRSPAMGRVDGLEVLKPPVTERIPVKWDGPRIAAPLGKRYGDAPESMAREGIEGDWITVTFDVYKDDMRQGAQDAQLHGYKGFSSKYLRNLQGDYRTTISTIDFGGGGGFYDIPDPSLAREEGRELVSWAVHSKPHEGTLFRGMPVAQADADALYQVGQRFSMPLSSFSTEETDAISFANKKGWVSKSVPQGKTTPVLIQLEPGAKVAYVSNGEYVGFGKFEVLDILEPRKVYSYDLAEWVDSPKILVVRQYSMREAVEQATKEPVERGTVPEFKILGRNRPSGEYVVKTPGMPSPGPVTPKPRGWREKRELIRQFAQPTDLTPATIANPTDAAEYFDRALAITLRGPDGTALKPKELRRLATVATQLDEKYPGVKVDVVDIGDRLIGEDATTYPNGKGYKPKSTSSLVEINRWLFEDPRGWTEQDRKDFQRLFIDIPKLFPNWHPPGSLEDRVGATYTHEFGHALVNSIGGYANLAPNGEGASAFGEALADGFMDAHPDYDFSKDPNFKRTVNAWLLDDNISDYSYGKFGQDKWKLANEVGVELFDPNINESLAEAFDEVERLGRDKARPVAIRLHDLLVRAYKRKYRK